MTAGSLAVLTSLGVINSAGPPAPSEALAIAASKTDNTGSSRLSVTITETPRSGAVGGGTIKGLGAFHYRDGRGEMEYDYSGMPDSAHLSRVRVIFNGPSYYVRGLISLRGRWLRVAFDALEKIDPRRSPELARLAGVRIEDPTKAVKDLEKKGRGVREVGAETIFGVATTHYRARSDPDGGGPTPPATVDVWVEDGAGYLRKVQTTTQERSATVTTSTELYEFGVRVNTPVPPLSEQVDFAELLPGG